MTNGKRLIPTPLGSISALATVTSASLQSAYDMYLAYEAKIHQCDELLIQELENLPDKVDLKFKPLPPKAPKKQIDEGVDITAIEGIGARVGLAMLTEVGPDLSAFPSEKQFCSWLGLCQAITATTHKLARLIYRIIKHGEAYVREGLEQYENKNQQRKLKAVRKMAESLGLQILEPQQLAQSVS